MTGLRGLEFRLLGPVEVVGDGISVVLGSPKQRALLAELLLSRGAAVPRERLVDALWGEHPPASAYNSLQIYVHGLRRAVGADRVETRGTAYRVRVEPDELDVIRFERLVARGRQALADGAPAEADELLADALALWRGDALADLGDSPVRAAAAGLEELRLQALELRVDAQLELGEHEEVIPVLDGLVDSEPYRERLREQLVLALYRAGRQQDALAAYQDARRRLADDLGVEPGPALRELERAVLRQDTALALGRPAAAPRPSLPLPPTELVGRRLELAALEAMLRGGGARLVTLTGPGGTGKTRLALGVAEHVGTGSRDGAVFVDLSSLRDAGLVLGTVAASLGLDDPAALTPRLRDSSLILVLDNLEQVAEQAAPLVAELLAAAPRLRIVATSRIPLRVRGEREYPVPPLPVADPARPFDELAANEAVALFTARAAAIDPSFELTPANAPAVARICSRLDGLPLALELAAARIRTLPLDVLDRRLDTALDVLVGGARDLPPRQRTLRATLDWSFDLLDEQAQVMLPRLAVFVGGFTLDAAEAVAGAQAVDGLDALLEASLVRRREDRFHLLETIREYALERVADTDGERELRAAHAAHFVAVAEAAWGDILAGGDTELEGMAVLEREAANLRGATAFAVEAGDGELQVRLALARRWFWLSRGGFVEARAAFDAAVAADVRPTLHAAALNGAATFASRQGDVATAKAQWQEALAIYRDHGDDGEAARCLAELGSVAVEESELDEAARIYAETAELFHALGQHWREAVVLANLAAIAAERDDFETAIEYGDRSIAIQRELGDRASLGISLANRAPVLLRLGDVDLARTTLGEAIALAREYGHNLLLAHTVAIAAELAAADGEAELAARLVGATETAFAAIGGEVPDTERRRFTHIFSLLGPDAAARLEHIRETGRALTVEAALAEAAPLLG